MIDLSTPTIIKNKNIFLTAPAHASTTEIEIATTYPKL